MEVRIHPAFWVVGLLDWVGNDVAHPVVVHILEELLEEDPVVVGHYRPLEVDHHIVLEEGLAEEAPCHHMYVQRHQGSHHRRRHRKHDHSDTHRHGLEVVLAAGRMGRHPVADIHHSCLGEVPRSRCCIRTLKLIRRGVLKRQGVDVFKVRRRGVVGATSDSSSCASTPLKNRMRRTPVDTEVNRFLQVRVIWLQRIVIN